MQFLDFTHPSPAGNLALDEALLLEAEQHGGGEVLRIWELPRMAVILGAGGALAEELDVAACSRDQVPILRRASGGGAVLLGPGCLAYALVLSTSRKSMRDVNQSYRYVLGRLAAALSGPYGLVTPAGKSDLALGERKVSGNAQRRLKEYILHHGTLLYGFSAAAMTLYLRHPARQPEYRRGREHEPFVANLPLSREEIVVRLRSSWKAECSRPTWPAALVEQLVRERYENDAWIRRR